MSHSKVQSNRPSGWFLIGTLFLLLAAAFAVKLLVGVNADQPPEDAARIEERLAARDELRAADQKRLETYGWTDKESGAVQIPIQVAMKLTVADLQGSQPTAVEPVAAAPVPVPAATPPETPAAPQAPAEATPATPATPAQPAAATAAPSSEQ